MSIKFLTPLSAQFINDTTGVITPFSGISTAMVDAAYANWLLSNPPSPIALPTSIIMLPTSDPGVTGALHLVNNTLLVSRGPSAKAIQIGTTGPTGQAQAI
jgi:hypothetical protein